MKIRAKEARPDDRVKIKTSDGKDHSVTVKHVEAPDLIIVTKSGRRFILVGEETIELLERPND